jgi:hypothetical protein
MQGPGDAACLFFSKQHDAESCELWYAIHHQLVHCIAYDYPTTCREHLTHQTILPGNAALTLYSKPARQRQTMPHFENFKRISALLSNFARTLCSLPTEAHL